MDKLDRELSKFESFDSVDEYSSSTSCMNFEGIIKRVNGNIGRLNNVRISITTK
jgi:hypothetical protein